MQVSRWGMGAALSAAIVVTPSAGARAQAPGESGAAPSGDRIDAMMERAAQRSRRAVVVVRCGDARVGTAFSFGAPDRLATAGHVVECPRTLSVETLTGARHVARVVASDPELGLAILVADGLALDPLQPAEEAPQVGLRVVAIGFDAEPSGASAIMSSPGVVGQSSPDAIRTDVRRGFGTVGGPLLDAGERVVGVIAGMDLAGITRAVPVARLAPLVESAPSEGDVRSPLRLGFGMGLGVWLLDSRALLGGRVSASLDILDQLSVRAAVDVAGGSTLEWQPEPLEQRSLLVGGELTVGYRFRLQLADDFAITIEPYVGAWAGLVSTNETRLQLGFADPGCDPGAGPCGITSSTVSSTLDTFRLRPIVGVRVALADVLELGYELHFDPEVPELSTHVIYIGVRFPEVQP